MEARIQRRGYPSDLTDAEWARLDGLIPRPQPLFGETKYDRREIVNAIRYKLRTGCQWRMLPTDFPLWQSVAKYFYKWQRRGIWKQIHDALYTDTRIAAGREPEPSLAMVDSQSVKTTSVGGPKGFDSGKKTKGRKRHLVVDILGLLLVVFVTTASVQDRDALPRALREARAASSSVEVALVDGAYNGAVVDEASRETRIRVEVVKRAEGVKGFQVLPKRWIVERSFGWMNHWRQLAKEYDRTTASSDTWIRLGFIGLMLRRLTVVA
jgi:putative transposase